MKEIIGDDYPTYEDSVKLTLAEKAKASDLTFDSACTYLNEVEQRIHKENIRGYGGKAAVASSSVGGFLRYKIMSKVVMRSFLEVELSQ